MKNKFNIADLVQAVDYHYIKNDISNILFNVENLWVLPGTDFDNEILRRAFTPVSVEYLLSNLGHTNEREAVDRIQQLIKQGMLRSRSSDKNNIAPLASVSNYITFMINVSQRCNLKCTYCYVNLGQFDYSDLPIARMPFNESELLVENIYRHFSGLSVYGYHFYGGEPLLNFEAIKIIVEKAKKKALLTGTSADFQITTNGTLLTSDIVEFMDEHRFTVYYSFDSDQKNHDSARPYNNGSGSFNDVAKNLDLLRDRKGIHLILSSVISNHNCLSTAIEKLAEQGAHQCKAERARVDEANPSALIGEGEVNYFKDIQGLAAHYIDHIRRNKKPLDYRLTSKILQLLIRKRRDFFCSAGERMFGIAANGELYPCALHVGRPKSKLGNIKDGIDNHAAKDFRLRFSASGQDDCKTCWNRTLCGGGCSAMVDRFGHEKCAILRAESEAAIQVFHHFSTNDPLQLITLVSPKIAKWMNGEITDPAELLPSEPAAELTR